MRSDVQANLDAVRARIDAACARVGRDPSEVRVLAVTKGVAADRIAGITDVPVGENRVQELLDKQAALAGEDIEWHFIGTLQRNKVRALVGRVALIHSIDRDALAREVGARAAEAGIVQDVLVQVNTSQEASKHGLAPEASVGAATAYAGMAGLRVRGFMTIAAPGDPAAARAAFERLRSLRDRTVRDLPDAAGLSMGMSDDLEIAVEQGATIVRVGRALFGPRAP